MNKTYLGIIAVILLIIAGVYSLVNKPVTDNDNHTSSTSTEVTTDEFETELPVDYTDPNDIELDLSKLQGKDRLYTEEEGMYENLSEEERRLVDSMFCSNVDTLRWECDSIQDSKLPAEIVQLVSLQNKIAILYTAPSYSEFKGTLFIYNIENKKLLKQYDDWWNITFSSPYIVIQSENRLMMYEPGMNDFVEIPNSKLSQDETYLKWSGILKREFQIEVSGKLIIANIYSYDCAGSKQDVFTGLPTNCTNILKETRTFDLSNLP